MKHIYFIGSLLCSLCLLACQNDAKESSTAVEITTVDSAVPTPTAVSNITPSSKDKSTVAKQDTTKLPVSEGTTSAVDGAEPSVTDSYRDITVGGVKSACDLITEAEIRKKIPGFAKVRELKMTPRNSPDNHASACECRAMNENIAFVLGYRKNAANLQYIDQIIAEGEVREYAPNIPPYEPVEGLGMKAAFNRKHGYMKWVGENGVLVYAYVFPTTVQNVDVYEQVLYKLGEDIDNRFHGR